MPLHGGIFDIDGVVLDTPHERAWREALENLMAGSWDELGARTSYRRGAFTSAVYQAQVAGKPRSAGAEATLRYFQIPDPDGSRAREYADAKQRGLEQLAAHGAVQTYADAVVLLLRAKAAGARVCSASSSKNADGFLRQIMAESFAKRGGVTLPSVTNRTTLLDLFDADVNGRDVPRGKPDPALFLAAAESLGLSPSACFVVEDAPAGIAAAKAGGMYAIGVARHNDADPLREAGADQIVDDLTTLDLSALLGDDVTRGRDD